mmetsp:Transcript_71357/g.220570  ORF Transcript_71357/g.220570 Transcript_71357/m.220570 type:complete len:473 (-) Transcript_71357:76-1494(-)
MKQGGEKADAGRSREDGEHTSSWIGAAGVKSATAYYAFILVSTAFRGYESGIVSSTIPAIKKELELTYTSQGFVAAASDYGLLPSGILAIFALTLLPAYNVLRTGYFIIAAVTVCCTLFPSLRMLIFTRSVTSFTWGMAAVFYPAWVNCHGSQEGKTMRLAVLNAMMLAGILAGYVVGGVAGSMGGIRWTHLYGFEALLMFACAFCGSLFDRDLVRTEERERGAPSGHGDAEDATEERQSAPHERTPLRPPAQGVPSRLGGVVPRDLMAVLTCPLYISSVAISSSISGVVGFILYFVTQVAVDAIGFDKKAINAVVALVFIVGPVGGNIGGGWWLSQRGGYQNYEYSFRMVVFWVLGAWACSFLLPVSVTLKSPVVFTVSIFGLLLFGAAPIAAINGAAVNAVAGPSAATYGSGIQFFCQHLVKMMAPIIGGRIIDSIGLGLGFSITVIAFGGLLNISSWFAYWAASNHCDA